MIISGIALIAFIAASVLFYVKTSAGENCGGKCAFCRKKCAKKSFTNLKK